MTSKEDADTVVLDASAMVEALLNPAGSPVIGHLENRIVHVPAHFDSEVLSALGRLNRAGLVDAKTVGRSLEYLVSAPFERHQLNHLVMPAWESRHNLRLADGLSVALANQLGVPLLTADLALAREVDGAVHVDD